MREKLSELIEKATHIYSGKFSAFMIVSNGIYDGFWGINGYDNILILARPCKEDKWYILSTEADKFTIFDFNKLPSTFNLEIPSEYGVPLIWFNTPIEIDYSIPTSDVMGYVKREV